MNKTVKNSFAPTSEDKRIGYLDVTRGLAILGILIVNLRWFSLYSPEVHGAFHFPEVDQIIWKFQDIFIEGKFYSIFSLLFGWGIALQVTRSKQDDATTSKLIRRRLFFMLLLGGFHLIFIWEGDIVFLYGLVGFVLLALRNLSNKTLLTLGILLLLSPILIYFLKMNFSWINLPSETLMHLGDKIYEYNGWINQDTSRTDALRDNSYLTILKINLGDAAYRFAYLFFVSRFTKVLGAMLIGFVIGKTHFYAKMIAHKKIMMGTTIVGFLLFVPLNYVLFIHIKDDAGFYGLTTEGLLYTIVYALVIFPLALVYMIAFSLLYNNAWFHKILNPVVAVGRTAFSNYVFQSLIGILLFYGFGFGLMEQFGPLSWTVLGLFIFILQVIASNLWLRYFNFGPVEWIWRSLTYGKLQLLKKH